MKKGFIKKVNNFGLIFFNKVILYSEMMIKRVLIDLGGNC